MNKKAVHDIAAFGVAYGLTTVVHSPGSRNAPLVIAFARHPKLRVITLPDERSAAYVALGMVQQSQQPIALVCTSGTAAANYLPAVAEAFFAETPLVIFTADRPQEWIGQQDGQTIYQQDLFGRHVKGSYTLPQDYQPDDVWYLNRQLHEAFRLAMAEPRGPVHLNVPLKEPLYPRNEEVMVFPEPRPLEHLEPELRLAHPVMKNLLARGKAWPKVLLLAGQLAPDESLGSQVVVFAQHLGAPVIGDVLSNLHGNPQVIRYAEWFLPLLTEEEKVAFRPDVLISFGQAGISKTLKQYLRKYPAREHWHIGTGEAIVDTYQQLTCRIHVKAADFFAGMAEVIDQESTSEVSPYQKSWREMESAAREVLANQDNDADTQSEFAFVKQVMQNLPGDMQLHLANSMSVRYGNLAGLLPEQSGVRVWSNRGTSGIDGCTSTAVGHLMAGGGRHCLITGDMAFFYDRNAFWHNYNLKGLYIILINNHGGNIFRIIDGPEGLPETEPYFVTRQSLNSANHCSEYGIDRRTGKFEGRAFFEAGETVRLYEWEGEPHDFKAELTHIRNKIRAIYGTKV